MYGIHLSDFYLLILTSTKLKPPYLLIFVNVTLDRIDKSVPIYSETFYRI